MPDKSRRFRQASKSKPVETRRNLPSKPIGNLSKSKGFDFCQNGIRVLPRNLTAEEGNSRAQKNLAILYEQGEGTKKSIDNAIYWYKKAIENGCQET